MSGDLSGSEILRLLDGLAPEPLSEDVQDLYDAAYENMSTNPEKAIEFGQRALVTLDRLSSIPLGDSNALAYARGRCHLLIASVHLDQEVALEDAEKHYLHSRDAFYSRQWSHLVSLAYLGVAIVRRRLGRYREALVACKSAEDSAEHESIPVRIDVIDLVTAIEKERSEIQELLSQRFLVRIPIVSDIAAGLGRLVEDNIEEFLYLAEDKQKGADFGVTVKGNSMKGHNILPGDIALIRQQPQVELGEIAAVVIATHEESVGVLKRYYVERRAGIQHWFLKSSNPASEDLVVIPSGENIRAIHAIYNRAIQSGTIRNPIKYYENADLNIAGKCVGLVRRGSEDTLIEIAAVPLSTNQ